MRRSRAHRSAGLVRSLALLWAFLFTSAAILAIAAFALSSVLTDAVRDELVAERARDVAVYANSVLAPTVVHGRRITATKATRRRLQRALKTHGGLMGVSVWSRRNRLLLSTSGHQPASAPNRIGAAFRTRQPHGELVGASGGRPPAIVVWTPLLSRAGRPLAVAEIRARPGTVTANVASVRDTIWLTVGSVFVVVWLAVALLVRGAAMRLSRKNTDLQDRSRELLHSTRQLEESLIETIETLNAAVEARDPYTAGHSQRVRRVGLAIGRELSLPTKRLGTLANACLFHDIGKIGMPDSILTKPEPLSPAEAAVMREHAARGAEIVARISSLHDSVPAIRHHHERWDGLGYPDGLSGREIPLEAAIIALADAWDAMTTNRPYAHALDINEAMLRIRAGREKQFNPAVVDAFWSVAKRRPAEILPPDSTAAALAVV
jgi:putative nucleotidyltransferase with HDIG domain